MQRRRGAEYRGLPMGGLLEQIHRAAGRYRRFVTAAASSTGPVDRVGLFAYRTSVMESEVIKPLLLYLLDPEDTPVPDTQLERALDVIESWMVRRMLVRATTKSYGQVVAELLTLLKQSNRTTVGEIIERYLAEQSGDARYWPDDQEIQEELTGLQAYRRLSRARLRMVLEAIEDYERGWRDGKSALGGERVPRGQYAIEHVMPRKWMMHWPIQGGPNAEAEREHLIHTIGNLTLLTGKLNSKVSNGPWIGVEGKRAGLEGHDVLFLNRELLRRATTSWAHEAIRQRTNYLSERIIQIWKVPLGHRSHVSREKIKPKHKVGLADLIGAGMIEPGTPLYRRRKKSSEQVATLLSDGQIDVAGELFRSPSDAASTILGHPTNGWWFFLVDPVSRRSLRAVRRDYIEKLAVDMDDEEGEDDSEEDDT